LGFKSDGEAGTIIDEQTGERYIVVSKTRVQDIFERLSRIFKSGIEVLFEESSRTSAKHIADLIGEEKVNNKLLLSTYARGFSQAGFGRIEVCEFKPEKAEMTIRVWNNFFAEIRNEKSTYCSYMAGLMSGLYEELLRVTPNVREVKCIGKGDPYCEFHLTQK
jgi:predicted hydrocarbon binding protein